MENISRALLMAGGLLISLVIISMLMLMINSLTSYQDINNAGSESDTVAAFNKQYEAYNREDVRGNDLFTLANKVLDYNRRKTTSEVEDYDNGSALGYLPMTLTINFAGQKKQFATDGETNLLLKNDSYTASGGRDNGLANIINAVTELENKYPKEVLNKLAIGKDKIFITPEDYTDSNEQRQKKITAIENFNKCYGSEILKTTDDEYENSWNILSLDGALYDKNRNKITDHVKTDVFTYYEFIQFKRGIFKCDSEHIGKDDDTGRFTKMTFIFTGEFK